MSDLTMLEPGTGWSRTRRRVLGTLVLTGLVAGAAVVNVVPSARADASALLPARVSVDFGSEQGRLPRPERYNNFGNVTAWPEQRSDDVAFLNEQGLHGDVYRVWLSSPNAPAEDDIFNRCDLAAKTCDWSRLDAYLTQASTVSDSVLVNLNPIDFVEGDRPLKELEPLLELMLRSLKKEYPRVRYVEVFNEPDWNFHGVERRQGRPADQTTLRPDELYRFYVPFYEAVNEVNKRLRRADRLQVGGPALMFMDPKWLQPFLDDYAADGNPRKRLDFISYHSYLKWDDDYRVPTLYNEDLRVVASDRATLRAWLRKRRLPKDIPAFVTETGVYPGPAFDDPDPRNDYLRQAAGLATYGYFYAGQPGTYMFNWCVRHRVEERKDQLVTRTPGGPLTGTFTPYGNMMLMQSKMKDTRVSAVSGGLQGDNGVYALASKDDTGASLMVWNWQHVHDDSYRATIDMSRLPSGLRHGPVRRRMFRIDQTTSNYFTDPRRADLQLVDERIVRPGKTHSESIDLTPNAIYLILLETA
ncbi:hypothetical protein [Thermomonospora cellulosilytica]|uniref:Glycosyl hydrolase family 39 n=1 Tax=Thermomonospora cellulosilytica TaxID=1411118 RepID=A0A7W3R899_9ACTN|nr:hypothetical protein [Thermomonospora cellulosilytica]MBA9003452.1 hypothetical protein [Thermomonospora cellulosilytica]